MGRTRRRALAIAPVAFVVGGCVPAAGNAGSQDLASVWTVFIGAGAVVFGIVAVLTTWAVLRYRRSGGPLPRQVGGNVWLEAAWTILPLVTVLALFAVSFNAFFVAAPAPPGPRDVRLDVTAFRWGWRFAYPDLGIVVTSAPGGTPVAVLPVGAEVHVTLTATDVDHAFFVPDFLYKRDAIPGRPNVFDLRVTSPGTYGGVCAEYCGVLHADMPFAIRAVTPTEFDAWVSAGGPPGASPATSPATTPGPGA